MKTTTTKQFIVSLTIGTLLFVTTSFKMLGTESKYATMRVYESNNTKGKIVIVYEDGKMEEIELNIWTFKHMSDNSVKINQTLNNIASKGYDLVAITGTPINVTIYEFIKK